MASHAHAMLLQDIKDVDKVWTHAVRQLVQGSHEIVLPSQSINEHGLVDTIAKRFSSAVGAECTLIHDTVNDAVRILAPPNTVISPGHLSGLLGGSDTASEVGTTSSSLQPTTMTGFGHTATSSINNEALSQLTTVNSGLSNGQMASAGSGNIDNPFFAAGQLAQAPSSIANSTGQAALATFVSSGIPMSGTTAPQLQLGGNINASAQPAPVTTRAARRKAKGKGVPRPQNCYLLYRGYHHPIIVAQNPGIHNNEVSVIIGKMWRELPEGAKKYWKEKAQAVKLQHEKDHPGYVYQPRKPSQIRSRTKKIKAGTDPSRVTFDFTPTMTGYQDFSVALAEYNRTHQLGQLPESQHGIMSTDLNVCAHEGQCQVGGCEQHFDLSQFEGQAQAAEGGFGQAFAHQFEPGNTGLPFDTGFLNTPTGGTLEGPTWAEEQRIQLELFRQPQLDLDFDFSF